MNKEEYIRILKEFEAGDDAAQIVKDGIEMILAENERLTEIEQEHQIWAGQLEQMLTMTEIMRGE